MPPTLKSVFRRKDGSSFPVEYVCTPIREKADLVGAVIVFRDISERLAIEQMKEQFISIVSHELRTPSQRIRGAIGLLASGRLGELSLKGQRMLQIALSNNERLTRLINDILDLEQMSAGKMKLTPGRCNVAAVIEQAAHEMRLKAQETRNHSICAASSNGAFHGRFVSRSRSPVPGIDKFT